MNTDTARRPTLVAGVVALVVVAFAATRLAGTYQGLAYLAAAGGALLAVSTGLAARDEPVAVFVASAVAPAGGLAVLAAAGLSVADFPLYRGVLDPLVMVALAAAGFGAVAAFTGGVGGGAVGRAFSVVVATSIPPFVGALVAVFGHLGTDAALVGTAWGVLGLLGRLVVTPTGSAVDVVVFAVVLAVTARALAAGIDNAPLVELAAREHRDAVARWSDVAVGVCLSIWRFLAVSWAFVFVGFVSGLSRQVLAVVPGAVADAVGALASAAVVRYLMLAAVAASLLVVFALRAGRLVTGGHREGLRRLAPTLGGGVLAVVVGTVLARPLLVRAYRATPEPVQPGFSRFVETFGEPGVALMALVAPLVGVAALLLLFAGVNRLGAAPDRAAPAAVASGGLVLAGAVVGVQHGGSALVFGLVAAGMVVWDVGEYGVGLAAELGRRAPTARAELVHAGAAVLVGLLAYFGAGVLSDVSGGIAAPATGPALVALAAAGVGVAALVAVLAE